MEIGGGEGQVALGRQGCSDQMRRIEDSGGKRVCRTEDVGYGSSGLEKVTLDGVGRDGLPPLPPVPSTTSDCRRGQGADASRMLR
jgi:hypothetical protein